MADQLFVDQTLTAKYRLHRPGYPQQLFDHILDYYFDGNSINKKIPLALDVACGSGQATVDLSKFCEQVIGIDVSENQLANAIQKDNVEYRLQPGEDLTFLEENSVDLVTIAVGLHWLEIEKFIEQVQRVLKRNTGVFAVWTYASFGLDNSKADAIYQEFSKIQLFAYWNPKKWLGDDFYQSLLPLLPYESTRQEYKIEQTKTMTIKQFIGVIETLSASQAYRQQNGEEAYQDMLTRFAEKLLQCYIIPKKMNNNEELPNYDSITVKMSYPVRIYLMRKGHD